MALDPDEYTTIHPVVRTMRLLSFTGADKVFTIGFGAVYFVSLLITEGVASLQQIILFGGPLLWILARITPRNKEIPYYYRPVQFVKNSYRKLFPYLYRDRRVDIRSEEQIRGDVPVEAIKERGIQSLVDRWRRPPVRLEVHEFGPEEGESIGMIYNGHQDTYSIVFRCLGSPISSLNMQGQFGANREFANLQRKAAAAAGNIPLKVSYGVRTRPEDPWLLHNLVSAMGDVDVVVPEALVYDRPSETYTSEDKRAIFLHKEQRAFTEILSVSNDIDMIVIVTLKATPQVKEAVRKKVMNERHMRTQPITRVRDIVLPFLEKISKGDVEVLNGEGAELYLKKAFDVTNLDLYYNSLQLKRAGLESDQLEQWYPRALIEVRPGYVRIDNTWGATLLITTYPTQYPYPPEPRMMYFGEARWFSSCVIGETLRGGREYNVLNLFRNLAQGVATITGRSNPDARSRIRGQELEDRMYELASAHFAQDWCAYVAVSASSLEELELEVEKEMNRLSVGGFSPIRVMDPADQYRLFATATTMIDHF